VVHHSRSGCALDSMAQCGTARQQCPSTARPLREPAPAENTRQIGYKQLACTRVHGQTTHHKALMHLHSCNGSWHIHSKITYALAGLSVFIISGHTRQHPIPNANTIQQTMLQLTPIHLQLLQQQWSHYHCHWHHQPLHSLPHPLPLHH
jgi:hypothetical protein